MWMSNCSSVICWKDFLCLFVKEQLASTCRGSVSGLPILSHWSICIFFCQYHTLSLYLYIQSGPLTFFFCWLLDPLPHHIKFRIHLSIFTKNEWTNKTTRLGFWLGLHYVCSTTKRTDILSLLSMNMDSLSIYLDILFLSSRF